MLFCHSFFSVHCGLLHAFIFQIQRASLRSTYIKIYKSTFDSDIQFSFGGNDIPLDFEFNLKTRIDATGPMVTFPQSQPNVMHIRPEFIFEERESYYLTIDRGM